MSSCFTPGHRCGCSSVTYRVHLRGTECHRQHVCPRTEPSSLRACFISIYLSALFAVSEVINTTSCFGSAAADALPSGLFLYPCK